MIFSQSCGTRARAVHDEMGTGNAPMDFFDAADRENVAGRRTGELVGSVRGADGDSERIHFRLLDKVGRLIGIG